MAEEITATTIVESLKALIAKLGGEGADESTIVEALKTIYVTLGGEDDVSEIDTIVEILNKVTEVADTGGDVLPLIERNIIGTVIENDKASIIGSYAFYSFIYLSKVVFNNVSYIGGSAFVNCTGLTDAVFPELKSIGTYAFSACSALESIDFPKLEYLDSYVFSKCNNLMMVSLPNLKSTGQYALAGFSGTEINFPNLQYIGISCFDYAKNLRNASFPKATMIGSNAFGNCYNLVSLYLMGSIVCGLGNSNVFNASPIGGYSSSAGQYGNVYVPSSLYESYISATYWSLISSRIVSM